MRTCFQERIFTAIKQQIDTGNDKPYNNKLACRTPITFKSDEVKYLQKQIDAGHPLWPRYIKERMTKRCTCVLITGE